MDKLMRKKKRNELQILVIGLGRFGQSLALSLSEGGAEVMAIDSREEATDAVAAEVTHVMIADSTEETVLEEVGPQHFDVVVCAIGGDIQASILTTILLKEMGVKRLVAKASTALHGKALEKLGVDRVVYPERDMAQRLAQDFFAPNSTEVFHLTVSQSMFEMRVPERFVGKNLVELGLRENFGLNVLAVKREGNVMVSPGPTEVLLEHDSLLVLGNREQAESCFED